jgi:hypothetical protein
MRICMELFREPPAEIHWSMSVSSGTDIIRSPQVFGFSDIPLTQFIQWYERERERERERKCNKILFR